MRILTLVAMLALGAAGSAGAEAPAAGPDLAGFVTDPAFEAQLQQQLLDAKPGAVITLPAGHWRLRRGLSLTVPGVTIKGAGQDQTVLSFAGMVSGPVGLQVTGHDFTLSDLTIQDTRGDGVKINGTHGVTIRHVRVRWTAPDNRTHGAYGLYPVGCRDVLIEDSEVDGAADAGIYVGQSAGIIVRRNRAEGNVAGIEIENSTRADVYGNLATHNTGGILVFNMPNLPVAGHHTRVHDNRSIDNNTPNFGAAGTAVSIVPAGTGVLVLANDDVEITDNEITGNDTVGIAIASDFSTDYKINDDSPGAHDPYPERIFIAGNRIARGSGAPDLKRWPVAQAILGMGASTNVVWDGQRAPRGTLNDICLAPGPDRLVALDPAHPGNFTVLMPRACAPASRLAPVVVPGA